MRIPIGEPKHARHECWSLKVHATPLALLVDWIRRPGRTPYVRVSVQSVINPALSFHEGPVSSGKHAWISVGDITLGPHHTAGRLEDLAWELEITPVTEVFDPVARLKFWGKLLPLSYRVVSLPAVHLQGRLTFRGETWEGEGWGAITHGWGHTLPRHWFWVQAPVDPRADIFAEAIVGEQRLWRMPWPYMRVGYFWLKQGDKETVVLHPFTGRITVWGPPDNVVLRAVPWHGEGHTVRCRAHPKIWQKLGDDVINTLTGQVRVLGVGDCYGAARVEWRRPPVY